MLCNIINMNFLFIAARDSASLSKEVYLILFGIRQDLLTVPDPCEDSSSVDCPIKANTLPYEYNATVYIPANMPSVSKNELPDK